MVTSNEQMRDLVDNRVLFLHLLREITVAKFHEILAERSIHSLMCYSTDVCEVSLRLTLLFSVTCETTFNY